MLLIKVRYWRARWEIFQNFLRFSWSSRRQKDNEHAEVFLMENSMVKKRPMVVAAIKASDSEMEKTYRALVLVTAFTSPEGNERFVGFCKVYWCFYSSAPAVVPVTSAAVMKESKFCTRNESPSTSISWVAQLILIEKWFTFSSMNMTLPTVCGTRNQSKVSGLWKSFLSSKASLARKGPLVRFGVFELKEFAIILHIASL